MEGRATAWPTERHLLASELAAILSAEMELPVIDPTP